MSNCSEGGSSCPSPPLPPRSRRVERAEAFAGNQRFPPGVPCLRSRAGTTVEDRPKYANPWQVPRRHFGGIRSQSSCCRIVRYGNPYGKHFPGFPGIRYGTSTPLALLPCRFARAGIVIILTSSRAESKAREMLVLYSYESYYSYEGGGGGD